MIKICPECQQTFEPNRNSRIFCSRFCSNRMITRNREQKKDNLPVTTVWSCGGGVQSTAIAVLIAQGKLPKPDYSIMVDTGWEKTGVLDYVNNVIKPGLLIVGVDLQMLRTNDYSNNDLFDKGNHLRIPAHKDVYPKPIKYRTHCNETWKVKVTKRWMRMNGVLQCENWIGVSKDERRRIKVSRYKWIRNRYPLVELGMNREDCLWLICSHGWPKPQRSSCVFCPLQNDEGWISVRSSPTDWQRALSVEETIRQHEPNIYLHRSLKPLLEIFTK